MAKVKDKEQKETGLAHAMLNLSEVEENFFEDVFQLAAVEAIEEPWVLAVIGGTSSRVEPVGYNMMDTTGKWVCQRVEPHARVRVKLDICRSAYAQLGLQTPGRKRSMEVSSALVDMGAQMNLANMWGSRSRTFCQFVCV